jgi:hypothetical protein
MIAVVILIAYPFSILIPMITSKGIKTDESAKKSSFDVPTPRKGDEIKFGGLKYIFTFAA